MDNSLNVNTISQINKQLQDLNSRNKAVTTTTTTTNTTSDQYIPSILGSIKYAPSKRWVHIKTDGDDNKTRLLGTWIHAAGLFDLIKQRLYDHFEVYSGDTTDFTNQNNLDSDIPIYHSIIFLPRYVNDSDTSYSEDDDFTDVKTYINNDNKFNTYTQGNELFWNGPNSITPIGPGQLDIQFSDLINNDSIWIELPYPAGSLKTYTIGFITTLDWCLQSDESDTALYKRCLFIPNYNKEQLGHQSLFNTLGISNCSPIFDFTTVDVCTSHRSSDFGFFPAGSQIDTMFRFVSNKPYILPIGRYWNYEADEAQWFFADMSYLQNWERAGSNLFKKMISESMSKYIVYRYAFEECDWEKTTVMTFPTEVHISTCAYTMPVGEVEPYPEVNCIFWRHSVQDGEPDIIVMMAYIGQLPQKLVNGIPAEVEEDVKKNYNLTEDEDWEVVSSAYASTFNLSQGKEAINRSQLRYPQQTNISVSDILASIANGNHMVDSEDGIGLSSIGYNEYNSYELWHFSNMYQIYRPNGYNTDPIEFVIRDRSNPGNEHINYMLPSDLFSVIPFQAYETPVVDVIKQQPDTTKTNGAQRSIEYNQNNGLQLYQFDGAGRLTKQNLLNSILNGTVDFADTVIRVDGSNQDPRVINYTSELIPDSYFQSGAAIDQKSIGLDENTYNAKHLGVMELYNFRNGGGINTSVIAMGDPDSNVRRASFAGNSVTREEINGTPTVTYRTLTIDWSFLESRLGAVERAIDRIDARIDTLVSLNGLNETV